VRATFDDQTIVVYQAYSPEIAERAVAAGRFVPPFKPGRMTWIKPSFLWMMYRSGWATKHGQERVLAVTVTRDGFEWALANACLSHPDPDVYASEQEWVDCKENSPVRIQWDPERSVLLEPLDHRTIQIGLGADAARRYVNNWTLDLTDATALAHEIRGLVNGGDLESASRKLPIEQPYPLPAELRTRVGAT